jgi:hypothetical protein
LSEARWSSGGIPGNATSGWTNVPPFAPDCCAINAGAEARWFWSSSPPDSMPIETLVPIAT